MLKYSSLLTFLVLLLAITNGSSQDADIVFEEPIDTDTLTTPAEPIGGYKVLFKTLQYKINEGDSLGKTFNLDLFCIHLNVNVKGEVDSVWISPNHMGCPLHHKIAKELKGMKWIVAKNRGVPITSKHHLWIKGNIYFNKRVYKKYKCWPTFMERILAPWSS